MSGIGRVPPRHLGQGLAPHCALRTRLRIGSDANVSPSRRSQGPYPLLKAATLSQAREWPRTAAVGGGQVLRRDYGQQRLRHISAGDESHLPPSAWVDNQGGHIPCAFDEGGDTEDNELLNSIWVDGVCLADQHL
eukprot:CAMPEP_0180629900 /NCGR_PEP_ID=MMETSP1037_2-20121125/39709_1 /TAXON_ID=632150 /ORGANISM="Azadinium spinosum, Strain 3D9" /LENGTH=134 /DNA_ID=CAMNT_0022650735 /DNA_START=170 /DNA_END=574 /DNA_ORIENTATION=-